MRLTLKRLRLMELLLKTDTTRAPTFQLAHEAYRLGRGLASVQPTPGEPDCVTLELERTLLPADTSALIVLRPSDVMGGDSGQRWRHGKRVAAL